MRRGASVSLPWHKASTAAILGLRRNWTKAEPIPEALALVEMGALVAAGFLAAKSQRGLAAEWGWSPGRLRRTIGRWVASGFLPWLDGDGWQEAAPSWFLDMANHKRTLTPPTPRTTKTEEPPGVVEGGEPQTNHKRTTNEPSRAYSLQEIEEDREGDTPQTPPGGPASDDAPSKATKPPRKKPTGPYHEAIAAWTAAYEAAYPGDRYPWRFKGRDADGARVKAWLAGVGHLPEAERVAAIGAAASRYLRAVIAGTAWPQGEPPQTRHFTRDLARWLQEPDIARRPPPARGKADRLAVAAGACDLLDALLGGAAPSAPEAPALNATPDLFTHPVPQ